MQVFIVTGSNTGVGKETARLLYSKDAKVYIAARSEERANTAITDIKKTHPSSNGQLAYLHLDLADLSTIKPTVDRFASLESKLHVLINNAGVQALKDVDGSAKTKQGHEQHLGVNVLGVFLLTKLLTPMLVEAAKTAPPNSVRVVWVVSLGAEICGETDKGLTSDYVKYWPALTPLERYGVSKAGNWLHAVEYAKRLQQDGVVSVPCNPGHLKSDLYRDGGRLFTAVLKSVVLYPPIYGAYTELYSALSPDITMEKSGEWVIPWGRLRPIRKDMQKASKSKKEGGNGHATEFWEWTETMVSNFV
jgi:NAD(P)-dependent dehydrogenase (short-subunit alcohol dehydrogenase family)